MPRDDLLADAGDFPFSHTYDLRLHIGSFGADQKAMGAAELADAIQTIVRELTPEELVGSSRYVETSAEGGEGDGA